MSEDLSQFKGDDTQTQLSAEDQAILDAFNSLDALKINAIGSILSSSPHTHDAEFSDEDMLFLFAAEMDEDIAYMKRALSQLEQSDTTLDMSRFTVLSRIAHKVRGTSGAMECHAMAAIAHHIEVIVTQIHNGKLLPLLGLNALVQAVLALEVTLQDLLANGEEDNAALSALENELEQLPFSAEFPQATGSVTASLADHIIAMNGGENTPGSRLAEQDEQDEQDAQSLSLLPPSIHIDTQRFERLLGNAEQLAEIRQPLEDAQVQVTIALSKLHEAHLRLQQLESSLLAVAMPIRPSSHQENNMPASSLVERILKDAGAYKDTTYARKQRLRSHLQKNNMAAGWDELELERFSEPDSKVRALSDATAEVTLASAHVRSVYSHLHQVTQQYVQQATSVHNHLHLLRLTPLSILLPRLQSVLDKSMLEPYFEVVGETTEIDQDILDTLASPLLRLLHTCLTDIVTIDEETTNDPYRVWLHAQALGNEVTLELGFSMAVQGGALNAIHASMQQLGGSVELRRNNKGGVSFFLRFPRSQGTVRGLLVRVGQQQVVLSFSQVQRVSDVQYERLDIIYRLYKLLDFPSDPESQSESTPVVVLPQGQSRLLAGIVVDEIISDVEVVVKPLQYHLQRPGIAGTVLDGKGHILLLLDIPELLKHYTKVRHHMIPDVEEDLKEQKTQHLILIADDSTLFRKSLVQTLTHANYKTAEASDGLVALDKLTQNPPDVFLLDMEMPNLNGYDLLNIIHIYPELMDVKVIMLTSRTSDKHKQHALALGAHAYLTKPCPQDVLLETIAELLYSVKFATFIT